MKKIYFRVVGFGILLMVTLFLTNRILSFKYGDGIYSMKKFYDQEEGMVDVLVLGPSMAFSDINTAVLWDEYGIPAFDLAGSMQPMWNTYFYLKEALKTQHPKLIILDASSINLVAEYLDDSRIIKNTFGMKWSKEKIEAIKVSSPKERWEEFLFGYIQYHARYEEINREDFLPNRGYSEYDDGKGFSCVMKTEPMEGNDVRHITERLELYPKTEEYYRKIIELTQEEGIPLFIVISPFAGIAEQSQMFFNTASDIANEYQVPFMNYNLLYEDIGIDYSTDTGDILHLNYKGNQKYTRYLADYLVEHFDLEDHRGDERYASWERNATWFLTSMSHQEIVECTDLTKIVPLLQREDLDIAISVEGTYTQEDQNLCSFLEALSIPSDGQPGIWLISNQSLACLGPEQVIQLHYPYHTVTLEWVKNGDGSGTYSSRMFYDTTSYKKTEYGVNVLICSKITGEIVDSFVITSGEDCISR